MKISARQNEKKRMNLIPVLCAVVLLLSCVVFAAASGAENVRIADGRNTVSFSTSADELDDILLEAEERGVEPLQASDIAEFDPETREVTINRCITVAITDGYVTLYTEAYSNETVATILENSGILLGNGDVCIPKPDAYVTDGATILVGSMNMEPTLAVSEDPVYLSGPVLGTVIRVNRDVCSVLVKVNDDVLQLEVACGSTVEQVLAENGLSPRVGDKVNVPLDTEVSNDMVIRMQRVVYVNIKADRVNTRVGLYGGTVADALALGKVTLGEEDMISHKPESKVADEMTVTVQRVTFEDRTETAEIPYETVEIESDEYYIGRKMVTVYGENGQEEVTYRDRYVDGVLESTEEVSRVVTVEPINEEIAIGTAVPDKKAIKNYGGAGTAVDAYGNSFSYNHVYTGSGTAYYGGGICSTGVPAQVGVVAVDPEIIPYGSRLYIASCDGAVVYGYCIAGDTGGFAWNGSAIADLYYDTYDECVQFGRRDIMVYVLG